MPDRTFGPAAPSRLVPDVAGDVVAALLQAYAPGGDAEIAERAADLARELRLERAVPALVECLARLPAYDPVAGAALDALEELPSLATAPLLAVFERCSTRAARARVGGALVRAGVRDGRVRAALVPLLAEDPIGAAGLLAAHGDRDAVPDLSATLDRLALPPGGPGELLRLEEIVAVAQGMFALHGSLTAEQRAKFERAYSRSDELWAGGGPELDEFVASQVVADTARG